MLRFSTSLTQWIQLLLLFLLADQVEGRGGRRGALMDAGCGEPALQAPLPHLLCWSYHYDHRPVSPSKTVHIWFWNGVRILWSTIKTIKLFPSKITRFGVSWLKFWSWSKLKRDSCVPILSLPNILVLLQNKCVDWHDRWKAALGRALVICQAGW